MTSEVLYGVHPVKEALAAGRRRISRLFLARSRAGALAREIELAARNLGIPVSPLMPGVIPDPSVNHQGVAALVSPFPALDLEDVLALAAKDPAPPLFLILDGMEDPHNLGALVRTALCAGVNAVILPDRSSAPLSPAVSKASSGALEHAVVTRVVNLARAIGRLKSAGIWVFGADARAKTPYWDQDFTMPAALVVGGEGRGIRTLVARECDGLVSIPQAGPLGSLNASVAGALLLYEAMRQRNRR